MRLHHLEVTAFGPFSGTETIDFDALTDAGLFLLCGPTGAGKTSVLDAVCFGLYGEVPGDRNSAKRLRSDHAAAGVAPSVLLEVTINGRRFRIRRSPAWQRPKRRGTGMTTEQARVTLEEYAAGGWVHLSNRLDETGHQVTELLGMNLSQFTQVAMLPQGRFQSFLRARSDERHKVLQQLFRTGRFEDIERWLVAHRQALRTADKDHQDTVASVVSRLCEAAGSDLPDGWDLHELAIPADDGRLLAWAAQLVAAADQARDELAAGLRRATARAHEARSDLQRGRTLTELRGRHEDALEMQRSLTEGTREADEARARLAAARRAAPVAPLVRVAADAARAAETAQRALGDVLAEAARLLDAAPPELTTDDLAEAERAAREAASLARALLPREQELKRAKQRLERTEAVLADLSTEQAQLADHCATLPAELSRLRASLSEQISLAAGLPTLEHKEQQLLDQLDAARQLSALDEELAQARALLQVRIDHAQSLRERMHDVREARINGMAAELAAALASGESCPVCGSAEHPAVARGVDGSPTRTDEEDARTAYEDADFTRQAQAEAVATLERNRALAEQGARGGTVEDLTAEIRSVRQQVSASRAAGAEQERLTRAVAALEHEQSGLHQRVAQLQSEAARVNQEREHARAMIESTSDELSALFGEDEVSASVERLIETRSAAGAAFARARDALSARDAARDRAAEALQQALECAGEHGFESHETASRAALSEEDCTALEDLLRARDDLRVQAETILADPDVVAAAQATAPDLAALAEGCRAAEDELAEAGARARVALTRAQRLECLRAELEAALAAWAPTRSSYAVAQSMSTLAEGKGGDNTLQMRLSAYVLASRLEQVVAAANERLRTMSDERYRLEHSSSRGVGELRGGLSLQVRDEWTGESRDPATLSGGETFVASLALALGLADVVTQEAGGSNIDTLFIDEGFGTLDPDTLDDVMDTLDGLRDGGRVVGIVSHVPEMRTRIPAQLQIRKDRSGSHVVAAREAV